MSRQIDILLVDDHALLRKGLAALLAAEADITVVGEAGDGEEAIAQAQALQPDVVIMDISMPGLSGIDATRQICADSPDSKVIALSINSSKRFVDDMLEAGASGYLLKESAPEELVQAINAVIRGEMYLSTAITTTVVSAYVEGMAAGVGILQTKLHRPVVPRDLVPRAQLLERLEAGRVRPLTLVSAPAGYGKSTLISSWMDSTDWPVAWYSLDAGDRDLNQFLRYLIEALRTAFPDAGRETLALIGAPQLAPLGILAASLSNELDAIELPFILVLDDYQHIDATSAVNELLSLLLKHPPIPLHLTIIGRRDPPLQLAKLRALGQMTEIRSEDLAFSRKETASIIKQVGQLALSPEVTDELQRQVEGWAAGLQLISLALRHAENPERVLADLRGGLPSIQEYLLQEVLAPLPQQTREWLLRSSILGRFCASLCDALGGDSLDAAEPVTFDGETLIKQLAGANLFLIALDGQQQWFRYHHLFQELLQHELKQKVSSNTIAELHLKASQWFERHHLIEEAINHALHASELPRAAQIIERHAYAELGRDRWYIVKRWLALVPPEDPDRRPLLVLIRAWVAFFQQQIEGISLLTERVESLLDQETRTPDMTAQLAFFHGYMDYWTGAGDHGQAALEEALRLAPDTEGIIAGETHLQLGLARSINGQAPLAVEKLKEQMSRQHGSSNLFASRLLCALALVGLLSGDLPSAILYARRMLELAKTNRSLLTDSWGHYILACSYLHSQRPDLALGHFEGGVAHAHATDLRAALDTFAGLALTQQLLNQPGAATETVRRLKAFAAGANAQDQQEVVGSCEARLSLLRGDHNPFTPWARSSAQETGVFATFIWFESPVITRARVLIAIASEGSLTEAVTSLHKIRSQTEACGFMNQTIEVAALQALALEKQGDSIAAMDALSDSLSLAAPGGWIRPFIELGPAMMKMLQGLAALRGTTDFLRAVLAAFEAIEGQRADTEHAQPHVLNSKAADLKEPLTGRERDILALLAQRLQNKEIAAKLFVSPETVKSHLKTLYQKLDVNNRRDAAARAVDILASLETSRPPH